MLALLSNIILWKAIALNFSTKNYIIPAQLNSERKKLFFFFDKIQFCTVKHPLLYEQINYKIYFSTTALN